jgi:phosphate starvation-inducible PhoH-like protein
MFSRPIYHTTAYSRMIHSKVGKLDLMMKNKESKLINNNYIPRGENQIMYNNILDQDKELLVSVIGPPGTGKTLLACVKAVEKLKDNKIEKIIITRPVTTVEDEELGFLPGNIEKKMNPWVRPIYDVFLDFFPKSDLDKLISCGKIELSPLGFMRGRTFKNSFIIADEMQNSSPNQMLMLLTRVGVNSKIVITGDLKQSDIKTRNGLEDLVSKLETGLPENFYLIKMNNKDIQRSNIVNEVLKLYENPKKNTDAALIPKNYVSKFYKEDIQLTIQELEIKKLIADQSNNNTTTGKNSTVNTNSAIITNDNSTINRINNKRNDDAALIPLNLYKVNDKNIH